MKIIEGGVTAAKGFTCSGIHCGIRKDKNRLDLALIISDKPCTAAAVYTTNLVKGAPIAVTKENLKNGKAQAIICNSGIANTCAAGGETLAKKTCALVEKHTGISQKDVVVASTGVIGKPLPFDKIEGGMAELKAKLGKHSELASAAIMTTDTIAKSVAVECEIGEKKVTIGGIAKGSGMICPNMATMLVFVTTDAAISAKLLKKAIKSDVKTSFNMVSVDGDTSTNDMLAVLANGEAGNELITEEGEDYLAFAAALHTVTSTLSKLIAKDGEGATKLIECNVIGAKDEKSAHIIARSVIKSPLVKTAMFGADANWGRVLCAIGYSGAKTNVTKIDVEFESVAGKIAVCENGSGVDFSEEKAKAILLKDEIKINVKLGDGKSCATAWGCDLSYEYVRINGDYRT